MTTIEAVKRAYAEVMLNAAREAAARILAAERRAAALAGGMAAVRDDAVAALLRLKAISDARSPFFATVVFNSDLPPFRLRLLFFLCLDSGSKRFAMLF